MRRSATHLKRCRRAVFPSPRFLLRASAAVLLLGAGLWARCLTWNLTESIRFVPDLTAAWHWGSLAARVGWLNLYDLMALSHPDGNYILDYVPLRLLVCATWAKLNSLISPDLTGWEPSFFFHLPLLAFHTAMELAAAVGGFALVRAWPRRRAEHGEAGRSSSPMAEVLAFAAAGTLWLNPALLINSHGRPGTDVWILPFYIWAVYSAMTDRWLVSGLLVATGAMLKGQQIIVAPVFPIWALCARRPGNAAKWILGLALGTAAWLSPWLLTSFRLPARGINIHALLWCALATAGAAAAARRLPARSRLYLSAAAAALSLFMCIPVFQSGTAWFKVGFGYGAKKYSHDLSVGGAFCLASIVEESLHLEAGDPLLIIPRSILPVVPEEGFRISAHGALSMLYAMMLLAAGWVIARSWKEGSRRFLTAIALPWLVWFAFAPQVHERYLLFGAAVGGLAIGAGAAPYLAGLMLSAISFLMTIGVMLDQPGVDRGGGLLSFIRALYPGLSWLVIATVIALMFAALTRGRSAEA